MVGGGECDDGDGVLCDGGEEGVGKIGTDDPVFLNEGDPDFIM